MDRNRMIWGSVIISKHSLGFFSSLGQTCMTGLGLQRFSGEKVKTDFAFISAIAAGTTLLNLSLYGLGKILLLSITALQMPSVSLPSLGKKMPIRKCFGFMLLLQAAQEKSGQGAKGCRG